MNDPNEILCKYCGLRIRRVGHYWHDTATGQDDCEESSNGFHEPRDKDKHKIEEN